MQPGPSSEALHRLQEHAVPLSWNSLGFPNSGAKGPGLQPSRLCLQRPLRQHQGARKTENRAEFGQEGNNDSTLHLPISSIKKPAHYGHVLINYL